MNKSSTDNVTSKFNVYMCDSLISIFRKSALLWNNAVIIVGCAFMFLSKTATSPAMLIIGRFIVGINNGKNRTISKKKL